MSIARLAARLRRRFLNSSGYRAIPRAVHRAVIEALDPRKLLTVSGFTVDSITPTGAAYHYSVSGAATNLELEIKGPEDDNFRLLSGLSSTPGAHDGTLALVPDSEYEFRLREEDYGDLTYSTTSATTPSLPPPTSTVLSAPTAFSATFDQYSYEQCGDFAYLFSVDGPYGDVYGNLPE